MILVSACLLGHNTKYNGGSNDHPLLIKYNELGKFVAVCPECLGKLPIPHPPSEIIGGSGKDVWTEKAKVISNQHHVVTANFIHGAERVLEIAKQYKIKAAILKERSPSCGVHQIYDGTFSDKRVSGEGVATALLRKNEIAVYSEEEITEKLLQKLLDENHA
ncbi:DUF523 domain-containing protein [Anaerosinus gibii]|uniref:DUF523 domain-containing protein n=1 Tax=Selenobaculum gibii TaxID=3054208 RepID=A0A9Y2AGN6_9FIRM|nr:DUF523 domain-containing protein [Selenobaculum gbiensis]WIW71380.1 DUF523 domain-containing protein [Selenobaculum gbiensis]